MNGINGGNTRCSCMHLNECTSQSLRIAVVATRVFIHTLTRGRPTEFGGQVFGTPEQPHNVLVRGNLLDINHGLRGFNHRDDLQPFELCGNGVSNLGHHDDVVVTCTGKGDILREGRSPRTGNPKNSHLRVERIVDDVRTCLLVIVNGSAVLQVNNDHVRSFSSFLETFRTVSRGEE